MEGMFDNMFSSAYYSTVTPAQIRIMFESNSVRELCFVRRQVRSEPQVERGWGGGGREGDRCPRVFMTRCVSWAAADQLSIAFYSQHRKSQHVGNKSGTPA